MPSPGLAAPEATGGARLESIPHGVEHTGAWIGSPVQKMIESRAPVRVRLDRLAASDDAVLHELAACAVSAYRVFRGKARAGLCDH